MREYFAYIRVSTVRQGEKGASLPEQKKVITDYARREGMVISQWFEETETAAKVGRTQFKNMVSLLSKGKAHGLILHKIDRGARNLRDWAALSELSDSGVDVRIAGDSIDLSSRGGRLSADIQAVVAADYIRNLREEVKKGQRGRLGQGLYPWSPPIGYLRAEGSEAKSIDPVVGPLIRKAFEEYATGKYTLRTLTKAMADWGITTRGGRPLALNTVNLLLRRRFYIGIIDIKGESYVGIHEPLISLELFELVQTVLSSRSSVRVFGTAKYALRNLLVCEACGRNLYAETQKGHAYFRCHGQDCKGVCIRESKIIEQITSYASDLSLTDDAFIALQDLFQQRKRDLLSREENMRAARRLRQDQIKARLARVTDAYLDQQIDKVQHTRLRTALIEEEVSVNEDLRQLDEPGQVVEATERKILELGKDLKTLADSVNYDETAIIIKESISNCVVSGKSATLQWKHPFHMLILEEAVLICGVERDSHRTFHEEKVFELLDLLIEQARESSRFQ